MKALGSLALGLFLLAASANAQEACSSLALATDVGLVEGTQTLIIEIADAPAMSSARLAIGLSEGLTELNLGRFGILSLGIEMPLAFPYVGITDDTGALTRAFTLPNDLGITVFAQSVNLQWMMEEPGPPALGICTSNVASADL